MFTLVERNYKMNFFLFESSSLKENRFPFIFIEFQMISTENDANVGRQEFIDLLCRITNSNENSTAAIETIDEQEIIEEGEIIAVDDNDQQLATNGKEIEDGELTESNGSDVSMIDGNSMKIERISFVQSDDLEVLNLRLNALRSLSVVKKREKSHQSN